MKWWKITSGYGDDFEFHFVDLQILVMLLNCQSGYSADQICPNLLEMRFELSTVQPAANQQRKNFCINLKRMRLSGEVSSHRLITLYK